MPGGGGRLILVEFGLWLGTGVAMAVATGAMTADATAIPVCKWFVLDLSNEIEWVDALNESPGSLRLARMGYRLDHRWLLRWNIACSDG